MDAMYILLPAAFAAGYASLILRDGIRERLRQGWPLVARWIVWTATGLTFAGLAIGILVPQLARVRTPSRRTERINNLKQIGCALAMYASDHGDVFPIGGRSNDSLWMLHPTYLSDRRVLSSQYPPDQITTFAYVVGVDPNMGQDILVYDRSLRGKKRLVLYADGRTEFLEKGEFRLLLSVQNIRRAHLCGKE